MGFPSSSNTLPIRYVGSKGRYRAHNDQHKVENGFEQKKQWLAQLSSPTSQRTRRHEIE